jgi:phosphatidylglycerol---prolipoprotein diacylglyceryl transferase
MYPVLFRFGPLTIYSLGALWALAAILAALVVRRELKRYGYDPELGSSIVFVGALGGLAGARVLLILEEWEAFVDSPWSLIFSGAGFSWHGGLFGGALALGWWIQTKDLPWLKVADIASPALALGYAVGRIGCHLAGDATWGKVTDVPWAVAYTSALFGWVHPLTGAPYPLGVSVHPTPLYETIQSLIVFAILWSFRKRGYRDGAIFGLYLILAGAMRFMVEFWRVNRIVALGMTEYQWFSLLLMALGMAVLAWIRSTRDA